MKYSFLRPSCFLLFVCQIMMVSVTAQAFNFLELNTAANGSNSTFPIGALDPNWSVAFGDDSGPLSDFISATVIGNCVPAYWFDSPYLNADWLSYDFNNPDANDCDHTPQDCLDLFFRRAIVLPETGECGAPMPGNFCLGLDFYADNSVYSIAVNNIEQYTYTLSDDPYYYYGYQIPTSVNLCDAWQPGTNTLLIHIKSCPSSQGFLMQVSSEFDNEYLTDTEIRLDTSICSGQAYLGYDQSGIYYDTFEGVFDCDTIRILDLTIEPVPVTITEITLCPGDSVIINDIRISAAGIYFDTLSIAGGCDSILLFEVNIADEPFLGEDVFVCNGNHLILESSSPDTEWSTGEQSQSIRITEPGEYWGYMEDMNGCLLIDSINVEFGPRVFVPNVFSPNADGVNDYFRAFFSATTFDHFYTLKIWDRWGGLKFSSSNQDVAWDGKYKGEPCSEGVYVYTISYLLPGCGETHLNGNVTLLR